MRNIRAIFNQAISIKIITSDLYPFGKGKYVPPSTKKAKKSLSIENVERSITTNPLTLQKHGQKICGSLLTLRME